MKNEFNRRRFMKTIAASAGAFSAGGAGVFGMEPPRFDSPQIASASSAGPPQTIARRIKFAVIGLNHSHIYSQVDAVLRGGGDLICFYAKEPELAGSFREALSAGEVIAQ